jgi:hypothetical protein
MRERRRQVAVGVGLCEQTPGLVLQVFDGVGTGSPAQRRLVQARQLNQRAGEPGGISSLEAVHALPGSDGLPGLLGVVRGLRREQLRAEEAGFDKHRANAEGRNLGGQRLHPAFNAELRRRVGGEELASSNAGSRGDRHDESRALGAHNRQDSAGDIHRTEQEGLDLCPEVLWGDLLEEPGEEIPCVVDEHVDATESIHGGLYRSLRVLRVGDVQFDDEQVVSLADSLRHGVGVAASCDDRVPGGQSDLGDLDAHSTARAGKKPNVLLSHRTSCCGLLEDPGEHAYGSSRVYQAGLMSSTTRSSRCAKSPA